MIRLATEKDVARMLEIYAPYVEKTAVSFEYEAPSFEEFMARYKRITQRYPWIVWEEEGLVRGYAYADEAFVRKAFQWDADLSIYLDENVRGKGIGGKLYDCIEPIMRRLGYHNLYALITGENKTSCSFHEKRGYVLEGTLKKTGYKFGKWYDLFWYTLSLDARDPSRGQPEIFKPEMLDEFI